MQVCRCFWCMLTAFHKGSPGSELVILEFIFFFPGKSTLACLLSNEKCVSAMIPQWVVCVNKYLCRYPSASEIISTPQRHGSRSYSYFAVIFIIQWLYCFFKVMLSGSCKVIFKVLCLLKVISVNERHQKYRFFSPVGCFASCIDA